jgi:hypothetical protein
MRIYITRTTLAARHLSRDFLKIKLNRSLQRRPSVEVLVRRNILPNEYLSHTIAPALISARRSIEKERVKDVLRRWVLEWNSKGSVAAISVDSEQRRPDVRFLIRRFARCQETMRTKKREEPTRAMVLGLRRFWESLGRLD